MKPDPIDVIWAGTYIPEFERNARLAEYLEESGAGVRQVRQRLWPSDRLAAIAGSKLKIAARMALVYPVLLFRLLFTSRPDLYLVSYPGWFDVPIVKLVAWLKRCPIVFDIFISLYDTVVTDRELASTHSVTGKVAKLIDRVSMRMSSRILADTRTHADFLAESAGLSSVRFGVLYVGADEAVFQPSDVEPDPTRLVFYGTFIPLQGVDVIVKAASRLSDTDLSFRLIGHGQTLKNAKQLAADLGVKNVEFTGQMTLGELNAEMAQATLCLGVFGKTPKTARVVPHKVYEALAAERAVLTGRTSAIREVFEEGELLTVPADDPVALANAIRVGMEDRVMLNRVAQAGRARFLRDFARKPQSDRLIEELERALAS